MTKNIAPASSSTQSFKPRAAARVELMPPSMTMRIGNRRLTLTWRPRKAVPQLLSDLLRRSWRRVLSPVLRVSVAAAAVCGAWQAPVLAAAPAPNTLPSGWSVVNGSVVFQQNGNVLSINQLSPQAIANFQSFSIGSGAAVNINQPSAAAAFLAKVTGGDISQIYGQLTAPGSVVLFNPAGIVIGAGGTVDVGRFIATTLAISDSDFLAGKLTFNKQGTAGSVENYGTIKSSTGGSVYLLGSSVTNGGVITSPQGEVILGAGETITLADTATPGVTVNVTGATGNVTNLGEITAEAGRIGVAAGLITNSGTINASSVVKEGGRVFLRASQDLTTTASSNISANGTTGGNVTLYAENAAFLDGDISAVGTAGKGGFIETSGLKKLDVVKAPTLSAGGEWYIDPYNLEITATVTDGSTDSPVGCTSNRVITSSGDNSKIAATTISQYLTNDQNVTIATGLNGGNQEGNIVVNGAIAKTDGAGTAVLTLNANGNITINNNITAISGKLNLNLNTGYQSDAVDPSRQIVVNNANISLNGGSLVAKDSDNGSWGNLLITGAQAVVNVTSGALSAGNVTVESGSNLYANGSSSFDVHGTLNNKGFVNISGAGGSSGSNINVLNNSGNLTIGGQTTATFENGATNSGNITVGAGSTIVANGAVTNADTGNITFSGVCQSASVSGSGTWTNNGNLTISGSNGFGLNYDAGTFSNTGNLSLNGVYQTLNDYTNTGTIKLTGSSTLLSTGTKQYGVLNIASGSTAKLANTHFNSNFSAIGAGVMKWLNYVYLDGAVSLAANAPELQILNEDSVNVQISGQSAGGTLTTRNTVYIGNSSSSSVVLSNGATWNNYGTVNFGMDGGTATMSMGSNSQLVNQQGGTLNVGSSTIVGGASTLVDNKTGGTVNLSGGYIGSGSLVAGDSSLYLNNSGTFNADGGSVAMKNNAGGLMNVTNFVTVGELSNAGNITVKSNANLTGLLTNTGNVTLESNGTLTAGKDLAALSNEGTLTLNSGTINNYGSIDNSGTLQGSGTINFAGEVGTLSNSGTVAPGGLNAVGIITLNSGKFEQTETGKLLIDIAGVDSYDKILFDGSVSLNGTLQTKLLNGYVPGTDVVFRPFGDSSTTQGSAFRTVTGDVITSNGIKSMVKARYDQSTGDDSPNYSVVLKMSQAETLTSTEGTELNWGSASTWDKGYIPTAIDSVKIASSSGVYNNGTDTIDKLSLDSASSLTLNGANLTASQISVGSSANFYVNRNSNLTTTQLSLLAGSNMSVTNANVTANQLSMAETSNLSMSGSNFTVNTTSQIDGILKVTSGNLTLSGIASGAGAINIGPTNDDGGQNEGSQGGFSSLAVVNTDVIPANVTLAGADSQLGIRVREGGNLVLNGGTKIADMELTGGSVTGASGSSLTIGANLTQSSGSLNAKQLTLGAGANASLSGGNVSTDQLTTAGTSNLTLSGGNMTVNTSSKIDGAVKVSTGNLTLGGSTTGNGTLNIGGANTAGAPYANVSIAGGASNLGVNVTNGGDLLLNGNVGVGNLTLSGGALRGTSSASLTVNNNFALASGTNLTVSNFSVSTNQLSLAANANLTVSGKTITANSLNTVDTSNLTLSGGNVTVNTSSNIGGLVKVGLGTLTLNGTTTGNGGIRIATADIGNFTQQAGSTSPRANVSIENATSDLGIRIADGGDLLLRGGVRIDDMQVTGGTVRSAAGSALVVSESFSQTGGTMTLNDAALSSNMTSGDLTIGNITANNLILESQAGAIKQTSNTALHVTKQLLASSSTGIALTSTGNQIAAFAANNRGTGDITLVNKLNTADTSAVTLNGIKTVSGNISVDNTGGMVTAALGNGANFVTTLPQESGSTMTVAKALSELGLTETATGRVITSNGKLSLVTHSPLTIGSGGVSATGNINLQAGSTTGSNSVLTINGLVSSQGGNIVLSAGDSMAINANITTAAPGTASLSVLSGNAIAYASNVVITDANGALTPGVVTPVSPVTPVTPVTPSIDSAALAAQVQQASQTQDIQRSVNSTELAKDKHADDDVKQSDSSQAGGQTQAGSEKKLPMCT